jgi:D-2-hydroxyacid dehydrogenase (NADP+)
MSKNVLVLNKFAPRLRKGLEPLGLDCNFTWGQEFGDVDDTAIAGAHVIINMPDTTSEEFFQKAASLEWVQCPISGTDHLVSLKSLPKDVIITNARGIHGPQMSEMAFLHMISLSRGYPRMLRNQDKEVWERWPQPLLYQKTVGIVGIGAIAEDLAPKCKAFNMTVLGVSSSGRQVEHIDRMYPREALAEVAGMVDYLVILVPYSAATDKIIDQKVIKAMKPSAYLINLARGGVLDEDALINALQNETIAGAGLDVYTQEPPPKGHPFWGLKNLMMTPKLGGMSDIYLEQVLPIIKENLQKFLSGKPEELINIVKR